MVKSECLFDHSPHVSEILEELNSHLISELSDLVMEYSFGFSGKTERIIDKVDRWYKIYTGKNGNLVACYYKDIKFIRKNGKIIKKYILNQERQHEIFLLENGDLVIISEKEGFSNFIIFDTSTCKIIINRWVEIKSNSEYIVVGDKILVATDNNFIIDPYTGVIRKLDIEDIERIYPLHSGWVSYNEDEITIIKEKETHLNVLYNIEAFVSPKKDDKILYFVVYQEGNYQLAFYNIKTRERKRINLKINNNRVYRVLAFAVGDKILIFLSSIIVIVRTVDNSFIVGELPASNSLRLLTDFGDTVIIYFRKDKISFVSELDMNSGIVTEMGQIKGKYRCKTSDGSYVFKRGKNLSLVK